MLWRSLGPAVLCTASIGPVVEELEDPTRGWSTTERETLQWAAHFWNNANPHPGFPDAWEERLFRRWVTAAFLRRHLPPDLVA